MVITRRPAALTLLVLVVGGCGLAQLQTARTVPAGATRVTLGESLVTSALQNGIEPQTPFPGPIAATFPIPGTEIIVRRGVTDRVDVGGRFLLGPAGVTVDAKWNLLPPDRRVALALMGGAGAALAMLSYDDFEVTTAHLPISILASVDLAAWLTPYVAVGYRGLWMWGADDPRLPDYNSTAPTGRGEGLLAAHAGVELRAASGRGFLLEYGYLSPLWHDPGHGYHFIASHIVSVGYRTGDGSTSSR